MDRAPAVWVFSDAPWAGGAERYLDFLLDAAGPERMGLVAVERPGLAGWIASASGRGFVVDTIAPVALPVRWLDFFRWSLRRRPRVLHVNMPGPNDGLFALAPLLGKLGGVPRVVVTEHLPSVGAVGRRGLLKRATVFAVDRAITVCEAHLPVMQREFGYRAEQLVSIANAIADPGPAAPGRSALPADLLELDPPASLRYVQVGSLDPRKGGELLLRSFAAARCDASLWFVGEGPDRPHLEALAGELGVADRVVFTGRRDDLPALLAAFDLVVLASEREGMPYVLIEAMAMARPVLATAVDGVPELVESGVNGILVGPGDGIGLARELEDLSRAPDRLARLGRAGRERFEENHGLGRFLERTFTQYGEEARDWPVSS